jgi:hypothetical protein
MNDKLITILPLVLIIIVIAISFYVGSLVERKRSEALQQVALEMGYTFSEKDERGTLLIRPISFELFSRGHAKYYHNIMRGRSAQGEVLVFDYRYTTGSGKSSHTHRQTVACFELEGGSLPKFNLRPENLFDKLGSALGYKDINFENRPDFSTRYKLTGENEDEIRRLFTDQAMSFYEGLESRNVCTEAGGSQLIYYRQGTRAKPEEVRAFLEEARLVFGMFSRPI